MKSQGRIEWLDFAKGITIFFVVLAHCVAELSQPEFKSVYISLFDKTLDYVLFIFIMPLFFSISGYLYKKIISLHQYLLLIYKKSVSLMIPYFIFSILITFFKYLLGYKVSLIYCIFGFKASAPLWFLPALFIIFLIIGLLDFLNVKLIFQVILFLVIICIQNNFYVTSNQFKNITPYMIISYILFFYLGIIIKKYLIISIRHCTKFIYMSILCVWVLLLVYQIKFTDILYQTNVITFIDLLSKILSVILFYIIFIKFNHNKIFKYFIKYGQVTLIIYLVHHPIITILSYIIRKNMFFAHLDFTWYCFLIFIATWIISIILCKIVKQLKILDFIFYPRKYVNKLVVKTIWGKRLFNN